MKSFPQILALLMACGGCQTQRGKLSHIDLTDGISQSEAMMIGKCYSDEHLGGGKITSIKGCGDHWMVLGKLGDYLAKPMSFVIDKNSGRITSQVGPSYDSRFYIFR